MWTLDEALILVRRLQGFVRPTCYHLALGGGVLNNGRSDKDLDLYFIPFSERGPNPDGLRAILREELGAEYNLGGPSVRPQDVDKAYEQEPTWVNGRFTYRSADGRRVDVFIA